MVRRIVKCLRRSVALGVLALCGAGMALAVEEPKIDAPPRQAADLPRGDSDRGGKLYSRYCRGCHGEEGKGDGLVFMPHVNNLTRKGYIENLPDDYLLLAISRGGPGIGKSNYMPAWEGTLDPQQMSDIIAYIRSLPTN
jgi:cytochrome c oxidase cbb3-type subunit III